MQFGLDYGISNTSGKTSSEEVKLILSLAKRYGIQTIDTARAYGESETVLGSCDLSTFKIVSKFSALTVSELESQLNKSLERLNIPYIYGYISHSVSDLIANKNVWNHLEKLKRKGLIGKIGFSMDKACEIELLNKVEFRPDLVQIPYNVLDKRFEKYAIRLKGEGCEIHSRSPFLQGLFFCDTDRMSSFFNPVKNKITLLQQLGKKLPGSLLKFSAEKPFIDKVIFGVNSSEHLYNNITDILAAEPLPEFDDTISEAILAPSEWPK